MGQFARWYFRKNLDSSRIKSSGWVPRIKLDTGIKKVIEEIEAALNDESIKVRVLRISYKKLVL